jgi:hypothetical protein
MAVPEHLTEGQLRRVRVGFNLPIGMVAGLDREARRRGVTRQALIKMWLSDRLDRAA